MKNQPMVEKIIGNRIRDDKDVSILLETNYEMVIAISTSGYTT